MRRSSHRPLRTCLGCGTRDFKSEMVRIAAAGEVCIDPEFRMGGRGGYIHISEECFTKFERSKIREFRSLGLKLVRDQRCRITKSIRIRLDSSAQDE